MVLIWLGYYFHQSRWYLLGSRHVGALCNNHGSKSMLI